MPGSMRFARAGAGVEESGGLSQPVARPGARRGPTTPSGREPSLAQPPSDSSCDLGGQHAACRDHSRTHPRRSTPASPASPAWRPVPPRPRRSRGRTVGSTTPGRRSARGHDVPPPRRRVVTNCRSRGSQPTVRATSAASTRHVVTTRTQTGGGPARPPPPGGPSHHRRGAHTGARSAPPRPAPGQGVVTTHRHRDAEWSRAVARAGPSRRFLRPRRPAHGMSRPLAPARPRPDPATTAPGNTKRGRPEGRPRGGVWRESC